tara:strand:- start:1087 stop:1473 length:387 start_codon:yes stop_codon:yes gene_type:complete
MKLFDYKTDCDPYDMTEWHEALLWVFVATVRYCREEELALIITSMKSDRADVEAVSTTHEDGRAFDIRTRDWDNSTIHKLVYFLNTNYSEWGAISKSSGKAVVALYHNNHIHIQVRPNANLQKYLKRS